MTIAQTLLMGFGVIALVVAFLSAVWGLVWGVLMRDAAFVIYCGANLTLFILGGLAMAGY